MPPRGPVVHGFAAEQTHWRFSAHCWSAWQLSPRPLGSTMMKSVRVLLATPPVQPTPTNVTLNDPGALKVCDGVADGSSAVPSPKFQRYWLMVVVAMGANWTVKGAAPLQDGTVGSGSGQPTTVKSTARGSGPASAGGAVSGAAPSGLASATGDARPPQEASRKRGRTRRRMRLPYAWGAGELRSPGTIAGGFGNPPRVPISVAWGAGELRLPRTIAGGGGNPPKIPISIIGWTRGIEPPAVGATVRCSTIELRPPEPLFGE